MQRGNKEYTEQDLSFNALVKLRCVLYGDDAVVIEGHKGLKSFSSEKIVFKTTANRLFFVNGKNLILNRFSRGYALVVGMIAEVGYESVV